MAIPYDCWLTNGHPSALATGFANENVTTTTIIAIA
jgi:hypothetical protein